MIRIWALIACVISSTTTCIAQSFSDLSDIDISMLVQEESIRDQDDYQDLLRLWTISDCVSANRLRVCYFPFQLLNDEFSDELNDWILGQSKLDIQKTCVASIEKAFPNAVTGDTEELHKVLINLASNSSLRDTLRVAALLTTTALDMRETRECLGLTAICLLEELRRATQSTLKSNLELAIQVLESAEESLVLANLLKLLVTLDSRDATDEDVDRAFSSLICGRFNVPFMVDEGNRQMPRTIIVEAKIYNPIHDSHMDVSISTTDFSVLDEFRSNQLTSFPRGLRKKLFDDIFNGVRRGILSKEAGSRRVYLETIANDVALLFSRVLQCDSDLEIFVVGAHLNDINGCADIEDLVDSPVKIPVELRGASCFRILEPEYILGRRTVDFQARCYLANSLGTKWELSLVSEIFNVHLKNDTTSDNDSPPER